MLALATSATALSVGIAARPLLANVRAQPTVAKFSAPTGFEWSVLDKPSIFERLDDLILSRVVRVVNHGAAFASLAYFGLISTTMIGMPMAAMPAATLRAVITKGVGPTSNGAFATLFPTLVTPANFVFLIWPVISVLQLLTLAVSALPFGGRAPLKQDTLSSLTIANGFACYWLLVSSNAARGALPLGSLLALPFVPLFAGYPLRNMAPLPLNRIVFQVRASFQTLHSAYARCSGRVVLPLSELLPLSSPSLTHTLVATSQFERNRSRHANASYASSALRAQVFSSFTTLASFLALAIELQHGGRLPLIGSVSAEIAALVFVALTGTVRINASTNRPSLVSRS